MNLEEDIEERLTTDFGAQKGEALQLLASWIERADQLDHPRLIRCAIYLANGSLEGLQRALALGAQDPRDLMSEAEYDSPHEFNSERLRDFNRPFGDGEGV